MEKKMAIKRRAFQRVLLLIAGGLTVCLLGCSGNKSKTAPFQMVFCSLSINDKAVSDFGASLLKEIPELTIDGKAPMFTPMIMGEVKNDIEAGVMSDPMMGMAGIMKMVAIVSTSDLDVFVSDMENAARQARGGMFMPLADIFSGDDLAALESRFLSFDILNTEGIEPVPTGEKTPVCGIVITGNEKMKGIFGDQEIGVFIIANTKNLELSKKVVKTLL